MSVRGGGSSNVRLSSTGNGYFTEYTTTDLYAEKVFGFNAQRITVTNDSDVANDVSVSYDGATLEGIIKCGETKELFPAGRTSVYTKSASGGAIIRIWAE